MSASWTKLRRPRRRPARGRRSGFTLIEVLVAFTIMAIALVALLQAFTTGLHGTAAAAARTRLLAHAESRLAEVGTVIPLEPGVTSGQADGYAWEVDIQPYVGEAAAAPGPRGLDPRPVWVRVSVRAPDGTGESLTTLRLAAPR